MIQPNQAAPTKRPIAPPIFALSLMTVSGGLCWYLYGGDTTWHILTEDWELMVNVVPRMALGVVIYGFLTVLVPESARALNQFVYYFALPPVLFVFPARQPIAEVLNGPFIGAFLAGAALTLGLAFAVNRL